ncbi:lipoprotein [Planotetraspora thailandica]|uniref:Lipoprotein n=1 Tax=Planotetraspora thailandica TaxID=487172 RepID=A0A8J3XZ84_9ACTN|nr:1-hydroxy-2-methyl-2-butenyl 4-diphosphate reductase [Planotetraspora thailandica]GII56823.1 lipoprotein [Planotetraspora thailandica]
MTSLIVCALGIEARAVRRGLPPDGVTVLRTGMGPRRAERAAACLPPASAVAVTGFAGALDDGLDPGDVLVASEVRWRDLVVPCPSAPDVAARLDDAGLAVRTGPLITSWYVVTGRDRRAQWGRSGARAADMESGPLAVACEDLPFAVVRVVVDTPASPLLGFATVAHALTARRTLTRIAPVLAAWEARAGGQARAAHADVPRKAEQKEGRP